MSEEKSIASILSDQQLENNKTDPVINALKQSLVIHWQQTQELTSQAAHLERWGYSKLAAIIAEDAEEEHNHARIVLKRLEFFDTSVAYTAQAHTWPRHDIAGIIKANLTSVQNAAQVERAAIKAAREVGDELTAQAFIPLLQGSEAGILQNEAWLKLIDEMGIDNFLTLMV